MKQWETWGIIHGSDPPLIIPVQITGSGVKVNASVILIMNPGFDDSCIVGDIVFIDRNPVGVIFKDGYTPTATEGNVDDWAREFREASEGIEPDEVIKIE